jgi:hypothetical protein
MDLALKFATVKSCVSTGERLINSLDESIISSLLNIVIFWALVTKILVMNISLGFCTETCILIWLEVGRNCNCLCMCLGLEEIFSLGLIFDWQIKGLSISTIKLVTN